MRRYFEYEEVIGHKVLARYTEENQGVEALDILEVSDPAEECHIAVVKDGKIIDMVPYYEDFLEVYNIIKVLEESRVLGGLAYEGDGYEKLELTNPNWDLYEGRCRNFEE